MIEEESTHVKESPRLLKKYDISIDNLTYEYIKNCRDTKVLEKIIKILRSGEEGDFPHLTQTAENELRELCPTNRLLVKTEPILTMSSLNVDDRNRITNEMESWSDEMKAMEDMLKESGDIKSSSAIPPIRSNGDNYKTETVSNVKKKCAIKSLDYAAWEKYDADKEIMKMVIEEERETEEYARKSGKRQINLKESYEEMDAEERSLLERQIYAKQEKEKGNECFKAGQYDQATQFYTRSITILPNVDAYNNRAQTNLKLKKYGDVIMDCGETLKIEPRNFKALYRRATAHECMGQVKEAMKDFIQALEVDPTCNFINSHVCELRKKLEETNEGKPKKARMVVEDMKSFEEELKSIQIFDKKVIPSAAARPLPNWKCYSSDPMSFGENKLNEWGYSKVMCNCTSIPHGLQKKTLPLSKRTDVENAKCSIQVADKYCNQGNKVQHRGEDLEKDPHPIEDKISDIRILGSSSGDNSNINRPIVRDMPSLGDTDAIISNKGNTGTLCDNTPSPADSSKNGDVKPMEISEDDADYREAAVAESPTSPYDFLRSWSQISDDEGLFKHAFLLKRINPSHLSTIIGNKLDGYMLSTLFSCLQLHFKEEEELLMSYLENIRHLPRFNVARSLLSNEEKQVVGDLIRILKQSGKCQVEEDLIKAYDLE